MADVVAVPKEEHLKAAEESIAPEVKAEVPVEAVPEPDTKPIESAHITPSHTEAPVETTPQTAPLAEPRSEVAIPAETTTKTAPVEPPTQISAEPQVQVQTETAIPVVPAQTTDIAPVVEAVPDPDEDDLDDLDDVLDDFAAIKLDSIPESILSSPGKPTVEDHIIPTEAPPLTGSEEDDFARQLQAGMADLLGELDSSPEMQAQFESMLRELGQAPPPGMPGVAAPLATASVGDTSIPRTATSEASGAAASFQDTIKKTMERMHESGESASAAAASAGTNDMDFMAAMLKEMEAGGGAGGEEDFGKMLLGMMEQLTNKEILYEPMKELATKFPEWMEKNRGKTSEADMARYETQQKLVGEITAKFELADYTDENVEYRQYIVDRMQQMQAAGAPPSDLVGDMDAAQEALGDLDAGCPTQ